MKKDKKRVLEFYIQNGGHPSKAGVDSAASVIYSSLYSEASGEKICKEAIFSPLAYPLPSDTWASCDIKLTSLDK